MIKRLPIQRLHIASRRRLHLRTIQPNGLDIVQQSHLIGHGITTFVFLTSLYNYLYYRKITKAAEKVQKDNDENNSKK